MKFDIVIVGGGLAGLSLAVALRSSALSVAVVEGRAPARPAGWDARIYAVSPGNERFLAEIGAWQHLDQARLTPVRTMEIHGDAGGRLDFSAFDSGVSELAWIIESSLMQGELWETVKRQGNVTLFCPASPEALAFAADRAQLTLADGRTLAAGLVVAADGADSWTRTAAGIAVEFKPYGETGVVANFACEKPHRETAFQWFRSDGVLAWLPLPDNMISIVWSTPDDHARQLLALAPEELCHRVAAAGDWRLGELSPVTPAAGFPLRLMRAPSAIAPRLALIGDAAHTIHPLSGHGINLGFGDSRVLAKLLAGRPDYVDCGDQRLLRRYERARLEEVLALQLATDGLQKLFRPRSAALAMLRNAGLNLTNKLPVVRDALVRYALG
ncbi:2-octaprenylphenol hydroxylase [mine drainage metagenome]|uniref:2-octaprenylphenol hydroxylase n=1 Tax=mine drainage metagenome TaxID=410659 RepID=A0A1J5SG25_9ZZZZ